VLLLQPDLQTPQVEESRDDDAAKKAHADFLASWRNADAARPAVAAAGIGHAAIAASSSLTGKTRLSPHVLKLLLLSKMSGATLILESNRS
jgi:hypothetical protein